MNMYTVVFSKVIVIHEAFDMGDALEQAREELAWYNSSDFDVEISEGDES